ncbi:MAG: tyrosine-type recombinase/integrase [Terracidiphilus sp.]
MQTLKGRSEIEGYDIAMIILETGLRMGELRELCWSDADLDSGRLVIHSPKCGQIQIVLLGPEAVCIPKSRCERRPESKFVWGSSPRNLLGRVTGQLRAFGEKHGGDRISLAGLRRVSIRLPSHIGQSDWHSVDQQRIRRTRPTAQLTRAAPSG